MTSGTVVEGGVPPEITGPPVVGLMKSWLPLLPDFDTDSEKELPAPADEQILPLALFSFICQSVVTHLARMPRLREEMGADGRLLERLEPLRAYSHGAVWVHEALLKTSGALILLHPPSRAGVKLRCSNVSNCFHLFSLLQTAVGTALVGGRVPDETVARVARGKSTETVTDEAWWHYGDPRASTPSVAKGIWGEGSMRDIPEFDGARVILAWPPIVKARHWDTGFMQPHLSAMPADVVMDGPLSAAERDRWFARLGLDG